MSVNKYNDAEFQSPPAIFRGSPLWSWNCKLDEDELIRQIDIFDEMGIGGFVIHPRTGLATEYLGDEFIRLVKSCRDYAESKGMLTWLYDEDRWPSGSAGGLVTKNKDFRARQILFTPHAYGETPVDGPTVYLAGGSRNENGELLATFAVKLENKYLADYYLIDEKENVPTGYNKWYVYLETQAEAEWFNNQTYVDTMNPDAIKKFIEVTHEKYNAALGESFGTTIPAIFSDEPQFIHKTSLEFAESKQDIFFPWTPSLDGSFMELFQEKMVDHFPELVWDLPDNKVSIWRYRYTDWISEKFTSSFADQVGDWCKEHSIKLTGHMMEEPTLKSQTNALGEAMRSYRSFQIPGVDMLSDKMELNTVKQAQSAARQFGCSGVLSELYGVTGWAFDFTGHKRQGDWQAALGVTHRVHHLSWVSMRGESKRDYPASIGYQTPWYGEYSLVENHFSRLGAVLSRGKAKCSIGVIHPIESYWLCSGPMDTSGYERDKREYNFEKLTEWLIYNGLDFDFMAESLLPMQNCSAEGNSLSVGEMNYSTILVPGMRSIRSTTLDILEDFSNNGGRILFVGEIPTIVDGLESDRALDLSKKSEYCDFLKSDIVNSLEEEQFVSFTQTNGEPSKHILHQVREDQDSLYLFACNTDREESEEIIIKINGSYQIYVMDTQTGKLDKSHCSIVDNCTHVNKTFNGADHVLLKLEEWSSSGVIDGRSLEESDYSIASRFKGPVEVTLDEPNALLIEKAQWTIGDCDYNDEAQLLNIENYVRKSFDLPLKRGRIAQPWTDKTPDTVLGQVRLKQSIELTCNCTELKLALENLAQSRVFINGSEITSTPNGYYVDKAIETIDLPDLNAGIHSIEVELDYTKSCAIEWIYVIGDFGVKVSGDTAKIVEPVRELYFGDWTTQGLPFYGGNVTYHCEATTDADGVWIPNFKNTVVKVSNKERTIYPTFPPYRGEIGIRAGDTIDIKAFGHRSNSFGQIHLPDQYHVWLGPDSWRTDGGQWCDEYQFKSTGILTAPLLLERNNL